MRDEYQPDPAPDPGRSFADFVAAELAGLTRYARALTGDVHAADDLVQDTLLKVSRAWRRVRDRGPDVDRPPGSGSPRPGATDPGPGNPAGYARTVLFRTFVSHWRRRAADRSLQLFDQPATSDAYAAADARILLRSVLGGLPPRQRAVLVCTYLEGMPDDEIAVLIGRTTSTVRTLRRRGLATVRVALTQDETTPVPPIHEIGAAHKGVVNHG